MASKTVSNKTTGKKPAAPAGKAAAQKGSVVDRIVEALDPFKLTGAAFDGGEELRDDCTAADLFSLVFSAPDGRDDFLEQAIRCVSDDLELIAVAAEAGDQDEVIKRVAFRNHFRIKVALRVAQRMAAAAGGAS